MNKRGLITTITIIIIIAVIGVLTFLKWQELNIIIDAEQEVIRAAHNGFYNPFWKTETEKSFYYNLIFMSWILCGILIFLTVIFATEGFFNDITLNKILKNKYNLILLFTFVLSITAVFIFFQ